MAASNRILRHLDVFTGEASTALIQQGWSVSGRSSTRSQSVHVLQESDTHWPIRGRGQIHDSLGSQEEHRMMMATREISGLREEEIPELEIDVDELLDMETDEQRGERVKELLNDCYKPTDAFITGLLEKIQGMQKLSTPQKK